MQFACLIYFDPKRVFDGSAESNAVLADVGPHNEALRAAGQWVGGHALVLPNEAFTVDVRDGKASITDGPFMETREMLGGITLIEADSREAAAEIAAGIPFARVGKIEVRPLVDFSKPRPVF